MNMCVCVENIQVVFTTKNVLYVSLNPSVHTYLYISVYIYIYNIL